VKHLSLFTGSGIGDLAAQAAGIQTVAQCESDPVCQYALRRLWPDAYLFEEENHE
jgi:site-specific DNA-cytosine methylase